MPERPMHPAKRPAVVAFARRAVRISAEDLSVSIAVEPRGMACFHALRLIAENSLEVEQEVRDRLDREVAEWRGDGVYMDITQCRSCQADIRWRITPAGKKMPLEVLPHTGPARGTYVIVNDHECRPSDPLFDNDERNFMNHWARCPKAGEFRGGS